MGRIKSVLNERRLAYEGAMRLVEGQCEKDEDATVLQYQRQQHEEGREVRLKLQASAEEAENTSSKVTHARREDTETMPNADGQAQANVLEEAQSGPDVVQVRSDKIVPQSSGPAEGPMARIEASEGAKTAGQPEKKAKVHRKTPTNPAEAAADALFGGGRRR